MTPSLADQATAFASEIEALLNATVTTGCEIQAYHLPNETLMIAPGPPARPPVSGGRSVPLGIDEERSRREGAPLWLRLQYNVGPDDENEHMRVNTSSFGYCVNPTTGYCTLRVEFSRDAKNTQKAHVNVHGESSGLAYAMSHTGRGYVPLSKLHIPMGGKRFRPTLEDFIEFLIQERLVRECHPGWEAVLASHRAGWEERQTRATVRRAPELAAEQLTAMGYTVTPPT